MSTTRTAQITTLLTTLLGRAPTSDEITAGLTDSLLMSKVHDNLQVGLNQLTIDNTSNLSTVLSNLSTDGGGYLNLLPGTYTQSANVTIPSNVHINGASIGSTIIDFNSTAFGLVAAGTGVYSTGTITVASGMAITGSGTSWLANTSAGQYLFLGTRWYLIAAVTSDTTIVLAESYGDTVVLPSTYRIASIVHNIGISNLTVKNSTVTGLTITDAREIVLSDVDLILNNKGAVLTNISLMNLTRVIAAGSTSNGLEMTNVGLTDLTSVNPLSNGGHGAVFNNVKTVTLESCSGSANTLDGFNITTGVDLFMFVEASANGGQGIELVSACDGVVIRDGPVRGNSSDGIKLTATATNTRIYAISGVGNSGYAVNIADSGCTGTILLTNTFASNASGSVRDVGTSTVNGASGSFTTTDLKTVTVVGGVITSIV